VSKQFKKYLTLHFQDDVGSVITDISSISGDPGHIEDTPLASGIDPLVNTPFIKNLFRIRVMVFNTTFNNIQVISWQSVLLVPGENH
jgi:hypothetical protein